MAVWRDSAAMREGMRLVDANVHRTQAVLVMRLVACLAPKGTPIVVTDGGFFSSDVLIVEGRFSGCRGTVPNEFIQRSQSPR